MAALAYLGYGQARSAHATSALGQAAREFEDNRFERPVLRGNPQPYNATASLLVAVEGLPPLSETQRRALADALFYGSDLPASLDLTAERRAGVDDLRAALMGRWAMTHLDLSQGLSVRVPDYTRVVDAALQLLAVSRNADSASCLAGAADVIRMGHDLVPGAPFEASSVAARLTAIAVPVLLRCATTAAEPAVMEALREARVLLNAAPTVAHGLALQRLLLAVDTAEPLGAVSGALPFGFITGYRQRADATSTLEQLLSTNPALSEPHSYPGLLEVLRKEQLQQQQLGMVAADGAGPEAIGFVYDDMRGQSLLRSSVVALSTLLWFQRHGRTPREPVGLHDPELSDPFTGHPLLFRFNDVEHTLVLWSVGEDRRDGDANAEWLGDAPADIVCRLHLPVPKEKPARSRARAR